MTDKIKNNKAKDTEMNSSNNNNTNDNNKTNNNTNDNNKTNNNTNNCSSSPQRKMDYLKIDQAIPGQKYALISMVEPKHSKLLMNREAFFAANFIQHFVQNYVDAKLFQFTKNDNINDDNTTNTTISTIDDNTTTSNFDDTSAFVKEKLDFSFHNIQKNYYEYVQYHGTELEQTFNEKYNTNDEVVITGFKIRGVYPNENIARDEVEKFHILEPAVDIYVAPVGKWIPYCSSSDQGVLKVYGEEKLNNIMAQKDIDLQIKKAQFEDRMQNVPKKIV